MTDDKVRAMLARLLQEIDSPEFDQRLAEREAARTDPWRWYCRLCGTEGESTNRTETMDAARAHIADGQPCGHGPEKAEASSGRLLHVWSHR